MAQKAKKVVKNVQVKSKVKAPVKNLKTTKKMTKPAVKTQSKAQAKAPAKSQVKVPVKPAMKISALKAVVAKPSAVTKPVTAKPVVTAVKMVKPVVTAQPQAEAPKMVAAPMPANNNKDTNNQIVARKPYQPMFARPVVPMTDKPIDFKVGDHVVYPAHGVGQITGLETTKIGGMEVALFSIVFEKDRMRLKVPVIKAQASGLRKLVTTDRLKDALKTLKGRARIRRVMWSRRAQEYEMKINSGDPMAIAEVLRDLKRSNDDSEQSYSERQIYQSALERLAREVAAVNKITEIQATAQIEDLMGVKEKKAA